MSLGIRTAVGFSLWFHARNGSNFQRALKAPLMAVGVAHGHSTTTVGSVATTTNRHDIRGRTPHHHRRHRPGHVKVQESNPHPPIYFEVAGGPYGEEPAVQAAGPFFAILGFTIFPFIWSIPEALIMAELSTGFPGNGGFVIWADRTFCPFFGSLMGTWKFLSGVISIAAFPALCIDYLKRIFPLFESGRPTTIAILVSTAVLSFLNFTGLAIVGYVAVALGVVSLAPFLLMSGSAAPQMQPTRLISLPCFGMFERFGAR